MAKCKVCNGEGFLQGKECHECEGTGVPLRTIIEERFDEASELNGTKLYKEDITFIEFEEDDYEI